MLKCTNAQCQVLKCTNARMHKCSIAQMQMLKCTNAQMHKCTNAQMLKCSNAQMLGCTNAQMLKCTNAQTQTHDFRCAQMQLSNVTCNRRAYFQHGWNYFDWVLISLVYIQTFYWMIGLAAKELYVVDFITGTGSTFEQ